MFAENSLEVMKTRYEFKIFIQNLKKLFKNSENIPDIQYCQINKVRLIIMWTFHQREI